ncbi:MAG: beta-propeller fold lactonase family protein, partial [Mucilaginibacter sp.]|nr:beta-propeller fold lactonase family protein [Mucilaginibacter sp.]
PNGKFLYASNRGDYNDISVFSINPENGELTFVQRQSTGGKGPRNFAIDPTGRFLLVAHQQSNDIFVYKLDQDTGKIVQGVGRTEIGNPVCLKFTAAQ